MPDRLKKIVKNIGITAGILGVVSIFCLLLQSVSESDNHVPLLFVFAVFCISRFTDGYLYGILASVVAVFCVNGVFTYPYYEINFTITGYPLTFLVMFAVAFGVSALTTQIKNQEQIRLEAEKEKMRGNLLRAISHDIRTPLTSIIGATSTVLDNPALSQEEQRALLTDVRDDAQWLIRVVENLLSITRIGNDQAKISKEAEAVEEVLGEAAGKFRKRFPSVSVEVHVPDDVLMVPMDPILIVQVLSNLLENAVFHGETTSRISLSARRDGQWACFSVQDDGRGIPPQKLHGLFDGTLDRTEPAPGDGKRNMGLGLSVCQAIVRAHGGTMEAHNTESGAEFTFRLPLSKEEPQP